jgi:predicted CXXCH cytochrome family protein
MSVGPVLLVAVVALVVSCDQAGHYEMMTFFFDGVEQPELPKPVEAFVDPNSAAQESQVPAWYVHEPRKDCTNCHDTARQSRSVGLAYLVSPVPELCYDCHDDPKVSAQFVHGPVAVGQCLQCHHHHKSRVERLLHAPLPELCYGCHDTGAIESIPAHFVSELSACTDCHNPHASPQRALLKEGAYELGRQRAVGRPLDSMQRPLPGQQPTARPEEIDPELRARRQQIADIFYASMDLYRDGKLAQARRGFVAVLKGGLIPQAMGTMIRGYIADIDKKLVERTK